MTGCYALLQEEGGVFRNEAVVGGRGGEQGDLLTIGKGGGAKRRAQCDGRGGAAYTVWTCCQVAH
jgi:hypothetical protein